MTIMSTGKQECDFLIKSARKWECLHNVTLVTQAENWHELNAYVYEGAKRKKTKKGGWGAS